MLDVAEGLRGGYFFLAQLALGSIYGLQLSRGVTNPVFAGSGSGTGTTTKGVGVGVAWIRIFAGIGSTHGICSFFGLHISNINSGGFSVISCKVS